MRILGIPGSLRRGSHNRSLLRAAAETLPPGAELEVWDRLADLPAFDEDVEADGPAPLAVAALRDAIAGADAVLIATPEYNASVPGALKNALDWASRPWPDHALRDKPVAVVGASTGLFGAVWAQAEVRKVLRHLGAHVIENELPVGLADGAFAADGRLRDAQQQALLDGVLGDLLREVRSPVAQAA
jgi:chromate reductase